MSNIIYLYVFFFLSVSFFRVGVSRVGVFLGRVFGLEFLGMLGVFCFGVGYKFVEIMNKLIRCVFFESSVGSG